MATTIHLIDAVSSVEQYPIVKLVCNGCNWYDKAYKSGAVLRSWQHIVDKHEGNGILIWRNKTRKVEHGILEGPPENETLLTHMVKKNRYQI